MRTLLSARKTGFRPDVLQRDFPAVPGIGEKKLDNNIQNN